MMVGQVKYEALFLLLTIEVSGTIAIISEASSDQEPGRASAGHDDDWEMASEGSVEGDNNMDINSADSGEYDENVGKPSQKESTKRGKLGFC